MYYDNDIQFVSMGEMERLKVYIVEDEMPVCVKQYLKLFSSLHVVFIMNNVIDIVKLLKDALFQSGEILLSNSVDMLLWRFNTCRHLVGHFQNLI